MLTRMFPETYTQAYHAGVLCAMAHNTFEEELPSFLSCLINFYALRELFGERLWQIMKSRSAFRERISLYESLAYQPNKNREFIGTHEDFALGYVKSFVNSKRKSEIDKKRLGLIDS
jgi:hypothetical protein